MTALPGEPDCDSAANEIAGHGDYDCFHNGDCNCNCGRG